jgi:hypothetical protein
LNDLLADENSQNLVQNEIMQLAYDSLTVAGVISNVPKPRISLSQGQIYTTSGLQSLNALNLLGGNSGLLTNILGRPVPTLNTLASGAVVDSSLAQTAINITNRVTGQVGALINNAGKFGSLATTAWANSGGIPNLSSLVTGVSNLPTLSGININQITGGLTNLVPGNIGTLKSALDNFGKASQFSLNFTNPLASVGNINVQGALTNLQGQAQGALTNLQGQAQGALTNLQGQAQGALTNLQGQLTNLQGQVTGQFRQLTNLFSGSGELVSGTQVAAGFNNTVNRKTVDAAVTRILGNNKIPSPGFEYPSPAVLAERLDIAQAQNILQGIRQQGARALNSVTQLQTQATRIAGAGVATFNRLTG